MSSHVFHPPTNLASQVQAYAAGLANHKSDYGTPPENAPADLKPLVAQAKALEPLAAKVADLELQLAIAREKYNQKSLPLWTAFSEKLTFARAYAKAKKLTAFAAFLANYAHHAGHHAAAAKAGAAPKAATPGT
jgi:hypothetical protein